MPSAPAWLGSIVGMVIGFVVFPLIIWYAYQMIFSMSTFTLHFLPPAWRQPA